MSLFRRRVPPQVERGDQFTKIGGPVAKVWEVVDLWIAVDGIPHARLQSGGDGGSLITIGTGVLVDPGFWQPVGGNP